MLGAVSLSIDGPIGLVMFLIAGAILGSGLGGVQVADRVLMVRLSPPERIGEFFGLYGLVGKGSQVIGQLLYGLTLLLFFDTPGRGAYQLAVLTLLATMLFGAWMLRPVRDNWDGSGEIDVARSAGAPRAHDGAAGAALAARSYRASRPRPARIAMPTPSRSSPRASTAGASSGGSRAPDRSRPRAPAGRPPDAGPRCAGPAARSRASAAASTSRTLNPPPLPEVADQHEHRCGRRRAPSPRARGGGPPRGRRRARSRGWACRPASGSRSRRGSAARPPAAAIRALGMRWVSGSWTSPLRAVAPATLK